MNPRSSFGRLCNFSIPYRATLLGLALSVWISPAVCGEIHDAARTGDLSRVKALVKSNPELTFAQDGFGLTPVHHAVLGSQKDVVDFLLASNADITVADYRGATPLHAAVAV